MKPVPELRGRRVEIAVALCEKSWYLNGWSMGVR